MAFNFGTDCLVTPTYFSNFIYDNADGSVGLDAIQQSKVEGLVKAASRAIANFTGRSLASGTFSEVWDSAGNDALIPREYPITAVSSIVFGQANVFSGPALPAETYNFDDQLINFLFGRAPRGKGLIQVNYTAGYSVIPEDLQWATLMQYKLMKAQLNPGAGAGLGMMVGLSSIGKQGETQTKDKSLVQSGLCTEAYGIAKKYGRMDAPLSVGFIRTS